MNRCTGNCQDENIHHECVATRKSNKTITVSAIELVENTKKKLQFGKSYCLQKKT